MPNGRAMRGFGVAVAPPELFKFFFPIQVPHCTKKKNILLFSSTYTSYHLTLSKKF
jgi:hypothetical protein